MQSRQLSETDRRYLDELLEMGIPEAYITTTTGAILGDINASTIAQLREFINIYHHGANQITRGMEQLWSDHIESDSVLFTRYFDIIRNNETYTLIVYW